MFILYVHNESLSVAVKNNDSFSNFITDEYGKSILTKGNLTKNLRYQFTGQEWDDELGLYFFPSRTYDPSAKRFQQTDPESQYHSPYLYVSADPVNSVDRNGNEGKPLVLFQEDHNFPGGMNPGTLDLQA